MSGVISKFNKVLAHPDKQEIIKRLLDGESVKKTSDWLRRKYPKRKRLQLSSVTLQKFRTEHLNLVGEVLDDVKEARKIRDKGSAEEFAKLSVAKSQHYQDKINQIVDTEVDASKRLLEMDKLINSRLIYYFNLLESGQGQIKDDKVFLEYIREYRAVLESWKKFIEGHADKKIEHNININVVNEQLNVLKGIIFEILQDMSPELVPLFVDQLNKKLGIINVGSEEYKRLGYIDAEVIDD